MFKYLIVQLSDSSVSYCNYNASEAKNIISIENLKSGLLWGVKQGMDIQILFPDDDLPDDYNAVMADYDFVSIRSELKSEADIVVLKSWMSLHNLNRVSTPAILHTTINEFLNNYNLIVDHLWKFSRLNVSFSDVCNFRDEDVKSYEKALMTISDKIIENYQSGGLSQFNLLTDRIILSDMNNCNAGVESITLAPDGKFYICPAFYLAESSSVGDPVVGVHIPNQRLLQIENAPICRICDAFQCRRCVWLNKKLTNEMNTPGHEQCIMSHIERRVSGNLLERMRLYGEFAPDISIPDLDYLDPFEKIIKYE